MLMISKKAAIFFVAIFLVGVALLYSQGGAQNEGEKFVLYSNFAYYQQDVRLGGTSPQFELPSGVEYDSVKLRLASGYVISQHINPANSTSEEDLLKSYIGKEVSVYDLNGKEIKGTLLKFDGRAYVQTSEGLFVITPSYSLLPGFSWGINDTNESVAFKISSPGEGQLSYLLDSIFWTPDYTLYLNGNGGTLSLYGAVTNSAKDYDNISLSLFYGQVKRNTRGYYYPTYDYATGATRTLQSASAPTYAPQNVFEYYKFDLGNVALQKGNSEFSLIEKSASSIRKTYEMQVTGSSAEGQYSPLAINLAMNNSVSNGLGIALPAGPVRVMNADGFVGEDYVQETPVNEVLKLYIGDAFDVIGTSKLVNQTTQEIVSCDPRIMAPQNAPLCINEKGSIYVNTYTYEATVKNKKSESVDVVLSYTPYGDWVMVGESMPSEKVSQNLVRWKFAIPADSEKTLEFIIRQKTASYPYKIYSGGVAQEATPG